MDRKRNAALPNVPSALEAGYPELSNVIEWYGIVVPAATPRDIITRLNGDIHRALNAPDVLKRVTGLGQTPSASTPDEFGELIRAEHVRWGKVVKASGAKAD
jgi:tripartite-type tricarboxylate transporter receptor subunit TctC